MASNRSRSRRCGLRGVAVWAVWALLATAAAVEEYDDVQVDDNGIYQEDNSLDTGPVMSRSGSSPDLALVKDVMLYKLIRSFQHGDAISYKSKFRPHWYPTHLEPYPPHHEHMSEKDGVVKRLTDALRTSERNIGFKAPDPVYRQQKWKIKKGSQMVCYFKLCAFRSPL